MLEQPLETFRDIPWLPEGSTVELHRARRLPPRELMTSVHLLCFSDDQLLMVEHEQRGWDIPGGHIEPGEELKVALDRELVEEAAAVAREMAPFAVFKINVQEPPADYKYPSPTSYICCFVGEIAELNEFPAEFETKDRRLMSPEEVRETEWYARNERLFELALRSDCR